MIRHALIAAMVIVLSLPAVSYAQPVAPATPPPVEENLQGEQVAEEGMQEAAEEEAPKIVKPNEMLSILFTHWEHKAIEDARRSRGLVRPPSDAELMQELNKQPDDELKVKPPPEERDISLGGIVYTSDEDWTIWLNGQRVTPKAIPEEVIDLKVSSEYIEMKWYDNWSNQIFPIKLRPHQRFNIDTRIFLPG